MPDKDKLTYVVGKSVRELRDVRMPGLEKPFEELTISELVQLRPGSEVADSYNVNAVTDNFSVSTSSILDELANIQGARAVQKVLDQQRLQSIRATVVGPIAQRGFQPSSPGTPAPDEVRLPGSDAFDVDRDPFAT